MAEIEIDRTTYDDVVVIRVVGSASLEELVETTRRYNAEGPGRLTLWDCRDGTLERFTATEADQSVEASFEAFRDDAGRRVASLHGDHASFGSARMLRAYTTSGQDRRGYQARDNVFRDLDEALAWLREITSA